MNKPIVTRIVVVSLVVVTKLIPLKTHGQDLPTKVSEYLASNYKKGGFTGVILIAQNDEIIFSKGYGMANRKASLVNTPQTIFRIGSLTKQFTAAAILQLQEEGKLNVSDKFCQYMQDCPETWKQITLHQLLTHTAGLFNYTDLAGFGRITRKPHTVNQLINRFKNKSLLFEPGAQWSYTNSGYCLLGYVIEKVSGKPYDEYLKENLFLPLRLERTGYDKQTDSPSKRARGYAKHPLGVLPAGYIDMSVPYAAGALYSTAEDLLKWNRALFNGKIFSLPLVQLMTTPYKNEYGYGLRIDQYKGHKRISHGGRIKGFENYMSFFPDENLVIIVLSNLNKVGAESVNESLAALCLIK